jgi:hypothetical protein
MMKTLTKGSAAGMVLLFVTFRAGAVSADAAQYEVTIPADNHRIAIVKASLIPIDKDFYMFPGAGQFPKRWSTFVSNFQVSDENDQPEPLKKSKEINADELIGGTDYIVM